MDDKHLWLEEVDGDEAMAWVSAKNEESLSRLQAKPTYSTFESLATDILTAEDRIAYASLRGGRAFNFWQDADHVKGIWRSTSADSYLADEAEWQTILDVDALSEAENQNWVFAGAQPLWTDDEPSDRYLITLSVGGRDAATIREFDCATGEFINDGFISDEAKQVAAWLSEDLLLIATDWGAGTTTESGYPLSVRRWSRGQDLEAATEIFRGETSDVGVWPMVVRRGDGTHLAGVARRTTFFTGEYWILPDDAPPVRIPIPDRADVVGTFKDQFLVSLQQDWEIDADNSFNSGDVVALDIDSVLGTGTAESVRLVFHPTDSQSVAGVHPTRDRVVLAYTDNVASQLAWMDLSADGSWLRSAIGLPGAGEASVAFSDEREATVLVSYQDFLTPDSLYRLDASTSEVADDASTEQAERQATEQVTLIRGGTERFDTAGLTVSQNFATSTDGTQIPYFLVHRSDLPSDQPCPTLLYGYGGFEVSLSPSYSATIGKLWLEQGGAYALANIRGGGEFGPDWHQAGLKEKRQTIYDDFIAVAEDLTTQGITTADHLGIMGGSNGGLLMGVMLTQRPDLWGAVVIQVPLLDMLRYHLLLAGASWVDEYGSPEVPAERAFLERISPYHRFDSNASYPEPFFVTSTKDDRVHPGHARKMAKLFEEADKPFLYYENIDGGHGAATTQIERAKRIALEFTYLVDKLMDQGTR